MVKLYLLTKKYLYLDSFELTKALYKSDIEKFNEVFEIMYGCKCKIEDEMVAQNILKSGVDKCGLFQFSEMVRGKK